MAAPTPGHRRSASLASLASAASTLAPSPRTWTHYLLPLCVLVLIVFASAAQTELTYRLTAILKYRQTYFTFWLTHVAFVWVFPVHLGVLRLSGRPVGTYLLRLRRVIIRQLPASSQAYKRSIGASTPLAAGRRWGFWGPFAARVGLLTLLISLPSISWFVAMVYTTAIDATAIYATSSFHTYLFSMLLLRHSLSRVTVASIALAFAGVLVIAFAGNDSAEGSSEAMPALNRPLGDVIMLIGAVVLGLYEVVYKILLPAEQGGVRSHSLSYSSLPSTARDLPTPDPSCPATPPSPSHPQGVRHSAHVHFSPSVVPVEPEQIALSPTIASPLSSGWARPQRARQASTTPLLGSKGFSFPAAAEPDPDGDARSGDVVSIDRGDEDEDAIDAGDDDDDDDDDDDLGTPPEAVSDYLPPAFHANFLTSCIGLSTLLVLWLPLPILHMTGVETFRPPPSGQVLASIGVVCTGGAVYNAGLMVLIGIWGPTIASVANLLTIGLVAVVDAVWVGHVPDGQTILGVGMICIGFGVLLYEGGEH